jgi:ubiquinone/menaquinone biosynthesis C-methylase UbiE
MNMRRRLSDREFKIMHGFMRLIDFIHPYVPARAKSFGIQPGKTVVDYGCGPGRYTVEFSRLTGENGKVYAVDLLEIALQETEARLKKYAISNVELKLAQGYNSKIPSDTADIICAVDMFHHVDPEPFLSEVYRISKPDGVLLLSGGHTTKNYVMSAVSASGLWKIYEEGKRFLKYKKP